MKDLRQLFGTDGIRGIANIDLTPEFILKVGRAGAKFLSSGKKVKNNKKSKILVGRDTRPSGDFISKALISAILASGVDVLDAEIITTPAVALLVKILGVDGGIVISASHNPVEDNGIKFFGKDGQKLTDYQEHSIERYILDDSSQNSGNNVNNPTGEDVGRCSILDNAYEIYINYLKDFFDLNLSGIKIAVDCANGAASVLAPLVFKQFGAEVVVFNSGISGVLINKDCGATHPEFISKAAIDSNSDIGIAFDGDADRVIICNKDGKIIDGDLVIGFCAIDMKNKNTLFNNCVVTTVMANMGLEKVMRENDIQVYKTDVGDRYVLEKMNETGSVLGGEQSGHIIFKNISPTGDGIISALEFLNVVVNNNYDPSEVVNLIPKYPQILKNIKVSDKHEVLNSQLLRETIRFVENKLNGIGRLLVRPSGTEPLIRVMAEAENEKIALEAVNEIISVINKID